MAKYVHLGIPVTEPQPDETYSPELKLFLTDPNVHPYQYECLRFEPDSPMPEDIKKYPHVAFWVDDLEAELAACDKVVLPVSPMNGEANMAFAWRDGVLFELQAFKK